MGYLDERKKVDNGKVKFEDLMAHEIELGVSLIRMRAKSKSINQQMFYGILFGLLALAISVPIVQYTFLNPKFYILTTILFGSLGFRSRRERIAQSWENKYRKARELQTSEPTRL